METFSCPEKGVLKVSSVTAVDGREQACVQVRAAGRSAGALHVGALFRSAWLANHLCCSLARQHYQLQGSGISCKSASSLTHRLALCDWHCTFELSTGWC